MKRPYYTRSLIPTTPELVLCEDPRGQLWQLVNREGVYMLVRYSLP